ncbi:xylose isomerase [Candidatus Peribacteria bacterium RIFCSPHIGHO2_02_FULL_53_20]|nr:MAG: xylose isomerase [Candidatus Peribacteria bacterium RIFCSPHIGHO2_02_FULL_53_20]OGJ67073.1 MAG: xylose isomerase [Candidatus Peribacteria bacterium RIFCSPLOWO2_01_FULL_53_10]OGJ70615.1 MAG: xylose isomerase [Candidatus Peribacteria bacterium RIFCSPLOWO2_12_FULL_53_10]
MNNPFPKLHMSMWPGLVGKVGPAATEPFIPLNRMLELTTQAEVKGQRFDGVDLFLFDPHIGIDLNEGAVRRLADKIQSKGLAIGSLVAPVWPGTVGDSAMGGPEQRAKFVLAVKKACRIADIFNRHGVRQNGVIRIDSAAGNDKGASLAAFAADPAGNTKKIAATFREAGMVAIAHGERLAAEGEICWGGMHSWKTMLNTLEETGMPGTVGFQADQAHTYLYLLGYNAPEHALLKEGYSQAEFEVAYTTMTDALRSWTIDFHVAQNDGTVHGEGSHDKTGRHCRADDPDGKLDITATAGYWLKGAKDRGMRHVCWDGCMFPNETLLNPQTYNTILSAMINVRDAHGWSE